MLNDAASDTISGNLIGVVLSSTGEQVAAADPTAATRATCLTVSSCSIPSAT